MTPPHVLVAGGGIGGSALAQGLRGAGLEVTVLERDHRPAGRWEGYRIHIDAEGARALEALLPSSLWATFRAVAGPGGDFGFVTDRLETLTVFEESPAADGGQDHYAVDRRALRRVLHAGLGSSLRFGAEVCDVVEGPDEVTVALADGSAVVGDLLVGADGVGSRVRRSFLPGAEPVPAGVTGIAARVPLDARTRHLVPARLRHGMNVVISPDPWTLFTSAYEPPPGAREALAAVHDGDLPPIDEPYLLAALVCDPTRLPVNPVGLGPDALARLVDDLVAGWHPDLRRMLAAAEPGSRGASSFVVSPRHAAWPTSRVTLLGDAIHAVPATGGLGGNAALRDARRLTEALAGTDRRDRDGLLAAVAAYESELRTRGHATITEALAARDQMLAHGRLRTGLTRAGMRVTALGLRLVSTFSGAGPRKCSRAA